MSSESKCLNRLRRIIDYIELKMIHKEEVYLPDIQDMISYELGRKAFEDYKNGNKMAIHNPYNGERNPKIDRLWGSWNRGWNDGLDDRARKVMSELLIEKEELKK
jgi:hypothetical protein